ncbi:MULTISPECIES: PTS glucose transporter subunit IIA [unclassified Clostridium]|nr:MULTISPECIES: PTS glucose transporter subunit IIA [unclassified Clostridium]
MLNKTHNKIHEIKSPINGKAILIEETGDSVFADKILGEGVAVMPDDG